MAERAPRRMTLSEFLEWQRGQELRYELVEGFPQTMTGAHVRHDIARGNADAYVKLDEYKSMASLDDIILMSPCEVDVAVWSRDEERQWHRTRHLAPDDVIPLALLGISLPLAVFYEGIEVRPEWPRAVE